MRLALLAAAAVVTLGLAGCTNPNSIGVQTYGTVPILCVRASDGTPVAGALVNAGSTNTGPPTDAMGRTTLTQVPVGLAQTIDANVAGLHGTWTGAIKEGLNPQVTISMVAN